MLSVLEKAAQRLGGIGRLADNLQITRQALYQWSRVPAERVIELERISGISRSELRPDLYPAEQKLDQRAFRDALGRFATGITVITTRGRRGNLHGLTANSFSALSLEPPLVLWCLNKQSPSCNAFELCSHFAINVLTSSQRNLSQRFATSSNDKFNEIIWHEGLGGAPVLPNALASFECRNVTRYEGGDHLIFVGEVERFSHTDGQPLLYNSGRYNVTAPHPDEFQTELTADDSQDVMLW